MNSRTGCCDTPGIAGSGDASPKRSVLLAVLLLLLPLLHACGPDPTTPEAQIRQFLTAAEQAVESRSVSAVSAFLSTAYRGSAGENRQAVMHLLAGYFVSHQSIHLLTQVSRLQLTGERQAEVTLYIAMAGQPLSDTAQLLSMHADLMRLDLTLITEQDAWRVLSAEWRRAERRDFLE